MTQPEEMRRLLSIGGSDSCGGAGVQGDIKTGAAFGVDVSTAITAITAQNSTGVQAVEPVSLQILRAQIASICSDLRPHAVKLGMLYDAARVEAVGEAIRTYELRNVVCDPVLVSTSGTTLLDNEGSKALLSLLPLFTLLTPNVMEAAALTGVSVRNAADLLDAGRKLLDRGAHAVLLKGGHLNGGDCTDMLVHKQTSTVLYFAAPRIHTRNDHGTGCVLATAIASELAQGTPLAEAVKRACAFIQAVLKKSATLWNGSGRGSMNLVCRIVAEPPLQ
jgi:hydroxymethylpyrimidine/phosphomethylpyrimidine kinase